MLLTILEDVRHHEADFLTLIGICFSAVGMLGFAIFGSRFLRSEHVRGQLAEKDETIATHKEVNEALVHKIDMLHGIIEELTAKVERLETAFATPRQP